MVPRATAETIEARRQRLADRLADEEAALIMRTLEKVGGRVTDAAVELRMNLRTLWRRIERYSIDPAKYRDGDTRGRRKMADCPHCNGAGCGLCINGKLPVDVAKREARRA